jgi:4,5-dihydroxyphthalate decarboxylase
VPTLALTLACGDYDRTRALLDGRVQPEGIALTALGLPVEEIFFRMLRHREFDAAEMSLSSYVVSLAGDDPPFVAIPVFPSRFFRHSCVYVHADSGIERPAQLAGRIVGAPEYQMTAPVWIRGILADEHGLPVDAVRYVTGGLEEPGRAEKLTLQLPPGIDVTPIPQDRTLADMLARGEIDALYTARTPSTFGDGRGAVRRLFADFATVERDYFRRTRIFPIMHTVVIRRDVYRRHPWVAQTLAKAFTAAQRLAYADLDRTAALAIMLPWLVAHLDETRREMGRDFWPYGFAANGDTLATFLRYSHEQGLSPRRLTPADLFAPETLESFKI